MRPPLRTRLSLHCPSREGASASPRKGQGQGRVPHGLGEGEKDNSLVGAEPLLLEMDHTQLDKYYKNLHVFLFYKSSRMQSPPRHHMQRFPVFQHLILPQLELTAPKDLRRNHLRPSCRAAGGGRGCTSGAGEPAGPWDFQQVLQAARGFWEPSTQQPNSPRRLVPLGSRDKCQLKTHKAP